MNGFIRRFSSLVYKETLQVLRDPSTILLGVVHLYYLLSSSAQGLLWMLNTCR